MNAMRTDTSRVRKTGVSLVAAMVLAASVFGPGVSLADDGGYPGNMLGWSVGVRAAAMGGAFTAISDEATGFAWNPAGVSQVREDRLESAWRVMSFDRRAGYVSFVHPFGREEAAMGLSWVHAGVGDIFEINQDGVPGGAISNATNAATFTFSRRFTRVLSIGLNLRYIQHDIANIDAYTVGFDVGVHLRFAQRGNFAGSIPVSQFRVGAVVQQLNQQFPWTTGEYWVREGESGSSFDEKFPLILRAGGAADLWEGRAIVSLDGVFSDKLDTRIHAGIEARPQPMLAVRAGLNHDQPTLGAGWTLPIDENLRLNLDYVFLMQPGPIDAEHMFSLGIRF